MIMKPVRVEAPYAVAAGTRLEKDLSETPQTLPPEVRTGCERVIEHTRILKARRARFETPTAQTVDYATDRTIGGLATQTGAIASIFSDLPVPLTVEQEQRRSDAERLGQALFPGGAAALTRLPYVEQWEAVQGLLDRVASDPSLSTAASRLGLAQELALLGTLNALYGEKIGVTRSREPSDEATVLSAWYEAYTDLLVLASYHGRTNPAILALIEAPYAEQVQKQAEVRARTRAKPSATATDPAGSTATDKPA